jgi:hypothetical protein
MSFVGSWFIGQRCRKGDFLDSPSKNMYLKSKSINVFGLFPAKYFEGRKSTSR